ncbi:hypothetical protein chiPu_0029084, partial [Chiloscyllium punctatum]|nr:hypothetical protein [Chiloscyllium punctatum]
MRLGAQARGVKGNWFVSPHHRGVAAAVPAHGSAERYMQVDRGGAPCGNGSEPSPIICNTDRGAEVRRSRIARIAGKPILSVLSCEIRA